MNQKDALKKRRSHMREQARDIKDIIVESEEAVRRFLEQMETDRTVHREPESQRKRRNE